MVEGDHLKTARGRPSLPSTTGTINEAKAIWRVWQIWEKTPCLNDGAGLWDLTAGAWAHDKDDSPRKLGPRIERQGL